MKNPVQEWVNLVKEASFKVWSPKVPNKKESSPVGYIIGP